MTHPFTVTCPFCYAVVPLPVVQPLTKRQAEIVAYLKSYAAELGYMPTFDEIADQFGYTSLATVHEHMTNLERKGHIKRSYNEARGIVLIAP